MRAQGRAGGERQRGERACFAFVRFALTLYVARTDDQTQTRTVIQNNSDFDLGLFGGVSDQPPLIAGGSYIMVVSFSHLFVSFLLFSFFFTLSSSPSHLFFFHSPPHSSPSPPLHPTSSHTSSPTFSSTFSLNTSPSLICHFLTS